MNNKGAAEMETKHTPAYMDRDSELCKQVEDLTAINAELLGAVKKAYSMTAPLSTYGRELAKLIAKAEGRA